MPGARSYRASKLTAQAGFSGQSVAFHAARAHNVREPRDRQSCWPDKPPARHVSSTSLVPPLFVVRSSVVRSQVNTLGHMFNLPISLLTALFRRRKSVRHNRLRYCDKILSICSAYPIRAVGYNALLRSVVHDFAHVCERFANVLTCCRVNG